MRTKMMEKINRSKFFMQRFAESGLRLLPVTLFTFLVINALFCSSETQKKKINLTPGILLAFDDRNMLNWEKQIPLFEKYNAHVTFFVDRFDQLSPDQIRALKKLKEAGHSVGCHGLRHLKAAEYCRENSVEKYIAEEIVPAIKMMEKKGFRPSCFAYPSSNHTDMTDQALLKYFRHLRSGCKVETSMEETGKAFVKTSDVQGTGRLDGISFHPKSETEELVIQAKKAINRIAENDELLVLYAHDIRGKGDNGFGHFITEEALEEILRYAVNRQVKIYSFDELP
jgi:hypothetical protein